VHPFVAPMLIGAPRHDLLRTDAETNPPTRDAPPGASVEHGAPLSVRIASGNPNSRKADSKTCWTGSESGRASA
jgi:hypothetical protein